MQGCAPLKKMQKRYIRIGMSLLFLILVNIGDNINLMDVSASGNQLTLTEIFPDRTDVNVGEAVFFTVHVTADNEPVPAGMITIHEETDLVYEVSGNISNGVVILEWIAQSSTPTGWCTFIANYEGITGYDPSSDTTQVSVADPVIPGGDETITTIAPDVTTVYPNDIVNFDIIITGPAPFFGGYVALYDITENIVLQRHDIILTMATTYSTSMALTIPSWYVNGSHTIEARYTGSYDIYHAPSSASCIIQAITQTTPPPTENYTILMTSNTTNINRAHGSAEINATIEGDDPTGKILRLQSYQNDSSIQRLLDEITVVSPNYTFIFEANDSYEIGPIIFELTLENATTNEIKAITNISATIYETIDPFTTTISLNQDIIDGVYGTIENVPVYITSSSGNPITDGQIDCYLFDGDIQVLSLTASISQGYTNFQIPIENFGEGSYRLFLEYLGNATQASTTYNATLNVQKGTATFDATLTSATIEYASTTYWFAHLTNSLGNPIANIPVSFNTSLTGFYWDHWSTILTNETGNAEIEVMWTTENQVHYGTPGSYTVRIFIEENDKVISQEIIETLQVTKNNVVLTLEDTSITRLGTAVINGILTDSTGQAIINTDIDIYSNATATDTWQKIATVTTDSYGNYFIQLTVKNLPGTYGLTADYDGDIYYTGVSKNAILEILDNPSEIKKIEITPSVLDLGMTVLIKVNVTDLDSINSVTATIYDNDYSLNITLDNIDGSFQKEIWCDTRFKIGTWIIDLTIIDNLGIKTTFSSVEQFIIIDNPAPDVNYTLNAFSIPDGSNIEIIVNATDSLGIASVKIEIESIIYDITLNNTILSTNTSLPSQSPIPRSLSPDDTYTISMYARGQNVFYFQYTPQTTGVIPFHIYVEDNAGQIRVINGNITVEAVAPELFVASMSSLNGTAPFLFSLQVNATDGSGINYLHLYTNDQQYILQYNVISQQWEFTKLLSANTYTITIIAEDNFGIQKTLDLGTLTVSPAKFEIFRVSENFFDGETANFTIQASKSLANANVIIIGLNEPINMTLDSNAVITSQLPFSNVGTYPIQFIVIDQLGTQISKTITFNITAKGPVFESVYPSSSQIINYRTPLTLELEALVTDASGVNDVILYLNDTAYSLTGNNDHWYTTLLIPYGTYTLRLVATDKYGTETVYLLGEITPQEIITSTSEPKPSSPSNPKDSPQNDRITEYTIGIVVFTLVTIVISVFMVWKKKSKVSIFASS
jgi:hypothetical protein